MQRTYQVTGLILLFLALFLGYEATKLDYFSDMGPGPGFFPAWLCGLLALLSLLMIVQASRGRPEPMAADFFAERAGYVRIAFAVAGLLAVAFLMHLVGYSIVNLVFFVVLLVVFGRRNPIEIAVLSAVGSFGVYYLFTHWLSQPLPAGPFFW